jgi:uncharacterized protein
MFNKRMLMVAGAAVLLAACVTAPPKPTLAQVGIYSAGTGSAFLPYAEGVSAHLTASGLKASALQTAGSIENARRLDAEPQQLATIFLGTAHEAVGGSGVWTNGKKHTNLRALFPMYETSFQLVALRSSGLRDVQSLSGKRVGIGPAGGPSEVYFKGLAQELGLQFQQVNGTPAEIAAGILAGRIDAMFQGANVPVPPIKVVADSADAVVFGLSEEEVAAMRKRFPYLSPATVPPGTYRGQTTQLRTVSAWNFIFAHKDLPDADAYWITRTVLSIPDPTKLHPSAGPTRAANAVYNTTVPFHPGALRYYAEQGVAGLK